MSDNLVKGLRLGSPSNPLLVSLTEYEGHRLLDIRKCFVEKASKNLKPTRKGISLNAAHAKQVQDAINNNAEAIFNWLERGDDAALSEVERAMIARTEAAEKEATKPREFHVKHKEWKGAEFFATESHGAVDQLTLNAKHPFFSRIKGGGSSAINADDNITLMLAAYYRAKLRFSGEIEADAHQFFQLFEHEWGSYYKIIVKTIRPLLMPEIWSFLGKARLQEMIGEDVLNRLQILLPALKPEFDGHSIYTREGLSTIFNSFSGGSQLENPRFRAELFNSLPPQNMSQLLKAIGTTGEGLEWSARVDAVVAAWTNPTTARAIIDTLQISCDFLPRPSSLPPDNLLVEPTGNPYKSLKDYQVPILTAAMQHIAIPRSRFVIQMPTGSGKTRTAMEVITQVLNDQPDGTVIIWLAHSEELCEQAYDCFNEVWSHVARRPLRLIRSWGKGSSLPFEFKESAFIVGGFAKLYGLLKKTPGNFTALAGRVLLLIVDEAHKIIAPTYSEVTKALIGTETRVMGLTATPGRSVGNEAENEQLAQFFFKQIVGLEGGQEGVLEMLRKRGVLSRTEYVPLRTSRSFQLSATEKKYLAQFFDLPPGLLGRLADDDIRNVEIIRRLQEECKHGGQILFFGCNVDHSKFICALLCFLDIKAAHLDGTTNRGRRQTLIADFRSGKVQVLCNFALLSTGFDAPKTDVVFIARPTGSIVLYSQIIGRGLRGPAIGGTAKCKVIDVIDNIQGFSDSNNMYHYFEGYFLPRAMV